MPRLFKLDIASEADVRVYVTDDRADADLIIYETADEWAATESPIWYYTDVLGRAERTIYFTNSRWEADLIVSYLPVGSDQATQWYAQQALDAGCAMVNCIPSFIASVPAWQKKFEAAGLPVAGDDIMSQVGATVTHKTLAKLLVDRGALIGIGAILLSGVHVGTEAIVGAGSVVLEGTSQDRILQILAPLCEAPVGLHETGARPVLEHPGTGEQRLDIPGRRQVHGSGRTAALEHSFQPLHQEITGRRERFARRGRQQ